MKSVQSLCIVHALLHVRMNTEYNIIIVYSYLKEIDLHGKYVYSETCVFWADQ